MVRRRQAAWIIVKEERGEKTGKGTHRNRGNRHKKASVNVLEEPSADGSSRTFTAETAKQFGISEAAVINNVALGKQILNAVGEHREMAVANSPLQIQQMRRQPFACRPFARQGRHTFQVRPLRLRPQP